MSSFADAITPMILTYNEAPNIARTLARLRWAKEILIIDSYSTDETPSIVRQYPQVTFLQRKFDSAASQCNFGLQQIHTPWVLSLDADYVLSDELIREITEQETPSDTNAYIVRFRYCIHGKPLRSALYPPRKVLYRRDQARYIQDGHTQRVQLSGPIGHCRSCIYHDDRKGLTSWIHSQSRYAALEASTLVSSPTAELRLTDRIRKTRILAPILMPLYCLILRGGVRDGWRGWHYALQRTVAEAMLSLELLERSGHFAADLENAVPDRVRASPTM